MYGRQLTARVPGQRIVDEVVSYWCEKLFCTSDPSEAHAVSSMLLFVV